MYKVLARRDEESKWIVKRVAVFSKANASEISARFEKEGFETCIKEYGTEQKSKKRNVGGGVKMTDDAKKELAEINVYNGVIIDILNEGSKKSVEIAKGLLKKNMERINAISEK